MPEIRFDGVTKVFGDRPEGQVAIRASLTPVVVHLLIVLWLGLSIPLMLATWFDQATQLISGRGLL